eukprot:9646492-Lingulodinium_polyedra.AAC.1
MAAAAAVRLRRWRRWEGGACSLYVGGRGCGCGCGCGCGWFTFAVSACVVSVGWSFCDAFG